VCAGVNPAILPVDSFSSGGTYRSCSGGSDWSHGGCWMPSGDEVICGDDSSRVRVWPAAGGAATTTVEHGVRSTWITCVKFSRDGSSYVIGGQNGSVALMRTADHSQVWLVTVEGLGEVRSAGFTPDASEIMVAGASRTVVIAGADGSTRRVLRASDTIDGALIDGGRKVAIAHSTCVEIVDFASGTSLFTLATTEAPTRLAARGDLLAVSLNEGRVTMFRGPALGSRSEGAAGGGGAGGARREHPPIEMRRAWMK
jgi:WD40 repeat protein